MRADSTAGRIIGALARNSSRTPSRTGKGFPRRGTGEHIIGSLARTGNSSVNPTSQSMATDPSVQYTASLAKELQFKVFWITTMWRWRSLLRKARTLTAEVLAEVIGPIWHGLMDAVSSRTVILTLAFLRLALPATAAVLLGLGLTGAHVWTAFIATLSLSVLIQTVRLPLDRWYWDRLWRFSSAGAAIAAAGTSRPWAHWCACVDRVYRNAVVVSTNTGRMVDLA